MQKRQRLSRQERREQILATALSTVAARGVRGATLANIAAGVGITYPALYAHFSSRKELLLALLDQLFERIRQVHAGAYREDAVEHLREIGRVNSRLVDAGEGGGVLPFFEFVAADPDDDLRGAFGQRELALVDELADIVRRGQRQGTIVPDADPEHIAWMIVGCGWTDDIAALMGLSDHWTPARSGDMLDWILRAIAVAPGADPRGE